MPYTPERQNVESVLLYSTSYNQFCSDQCDLQNDIIGEVE